MKHTCLYICHIYQATRVKPGLTGSFDSCSHDLFFKLRGSLFRREVLRVESTFHNNRPSDCIVNRRPRMY